MPFPESERVIYRINPLERVICQLRFPTILRIETELPAEFQELIRSEYPLFSQKADEPGSLPQAFLEELPPEIRSHWLSPSVTKNYEFVSKDEDWKINLTSGFIALTSFRYRRWEEFKDHLVGPFEALRRVYQPTFFTRIGLRYQDVIWRSVLNLRDIPWSDLLQPYILGALAAPHIPDENVLVSSQTVVIRLLKDYGQVRIRHGLARRPGSEEIGYIIDSDFSSEERTEADYVLERLNAFNRRGRRLFRWCITDRLHQAMEPEPIARSDSAN